MLERKLAAAVSHLALMASSVGLAGDAGDLNPVTFHAALKHQPVALVSGGKAKGEIVVAGAEIRRGSAVVSGEGGRLLSQAVGDLQSYIERSTGAQLPIANETSGKPAIVIGDLTFRTSGHGGFDLLREYVGAWSIDSQRLVHPTD